MRHHVAAPARPDIPLQKDGRSELQELAAALSQAVEERHKTRGGHQLSVDPYNEVHDLLADPEPPPTPRAPEPTRTRVVRVSGRVGPLLLATGLTAAVSLAGWTAAHHGDSTTATARTTSAPTDVRRLPAPPAPHPGADPASWGAAARARLAAGGRPVTVFACQAAYAADGPLSGGVLPPAQTSPGAWQLYLAACLSDMSDGSVGHSG